MGTQIAVNTQGALKLKKRCIFGPMLNGKRLDKNKKRVVKVTHAISKIISITSHLVYWQVHNPHSFLTKQQILAPAQLATI